MRASFERASWTIHIDDMDIERIVQHDMRAGGEHLSESLDRRVSITADAGSMGPATRYQYSSVSTRGFWYLPVLSTKHQYDSVSVGGS